MLRCGEYSHGVRRLSDRLPVSLRLSAGLTESDGRSGAPAGLQHSAVGGAAHRLHHVLRRDHPSLRHPAAAQRQEGGPGAGVRQVRQEASCLKAATVSNWWAAL